MGNYPDRCGYCDEKHQECTCQPVNPGWRMTRAHALAAINERFNGTPFAAESVMVSRSEFAAICSEHDQAALDLAAHVLELTALLEAAEARNAASERDAWLPIESAPKDRVVLIGWSGDPEAMLAARWYATTDGVSTWDCAHSLTQWVVDPTHWQPLPAAPEEG